MKTIIDCKEIGETEVKELIIDNNQLDNNNFVDLTFHTLGSIQIMTVPLDELQCAVSSFMCKRSLEDDRNRVYKE